MKEHSQTRANLNLFKSIVHFLKLKQFAISKDNFPEALKRKKL